MSRYRLTVCLALCFTLTLASCSYAQSLNTQDWEGWNKSSNPRFPGEKWMIYASPEEAGWSSDKLAAARRVSDAAKSAAVMVIYDGVVLAEWGQVERRFKCHSVRKSLLSALYGIAVARGSVDIEETIGSIGIDDIRGLTEKEKSAKVSDLLKARSGIYHPAAYETRTMKKERPARGSHDPGTHWWYNNWDFNVLATIFNKKTAGDVFESFQTDIAAPLQMQDFDLRHTYYHLEPKNSRNPAYPFRMTARDLARFGLLYLNEGRWKNRQVVASEWVAQSTDTHSTHSYGGYGYMWWTLSGQLEELGAYAAFGYGGQAIYVVPEARLVFVHRVNTYEGKSVHHRSIYNILLAVLRARIGPPKTNPALFKRPVSTPIDPSPSLTQEQLTALVGNYRQGKATARIREVEGILESDSPIWGRYLLYPRSSTEFIVEDREQRVDFELDGAGKARSLRIWTNPEEPYEMLRVR